MPDPSNRTIRPERKPSDWSPRPIPQPAPERRTADPVTPTLRELAARAQRTSVADATRVQTPLDRGQPLMPASHVMQAPAVDPEPQTLPAKRARLAQRRALIRGGRERAAMLPPGPGRERLLATAARFEDDTRAVDRMKLAAHVYQYYDREKFPTPPPPPLGYKQLDTDEELRRYNLSERDLAPPTSGFRAAVYQSVLEPNAKPVLVFRGTTTGQDAMQDWMNNLGQGLTIPVDYYDQAIRVGRKLDRGTRGKGGFATAGHSLGGGLASEVSAKYGMRGDTFNAAGVSEATLNRAGSSRTAGMGLVSAYNVSGEVLGLIQNRGPVRAAYRALDPGDQGVALANALTGRPDDVGDVIGPRALGRKRALPAVDTPDEQAWYNVSKYLSRHYGDHMLASFEQEKSHDSKALSTPGLPFGPASHS